MEATLVEINGNLFNNKEVYGLSIPNVHIVHCISSDYALGAEFAKEIEKRYKIRSALKVHGQGTYPDCLVVNHIINMVTKDKYWNKPKDKDFEVALMIVRKYCLDTGITNLVMPKIGCGLDQLDWNDCKKLIIKHLVNSGISVKVYYL